MDQPKRRKQIDIRSFDYSYNGGRRSFYTPPSVEDQPRRKKRKWPKRLFILLLITLIAATIAFIVGFLYLDNLRLKGEEEGRVNFVVSGVDEAANLSDTLMIVSLKTDAEEVADYEAAIISIPRDLYLDIPPFGFNKINAAYSLGENNDSAGGGAGLVRRVVRDSFDVDVHYQVTVNFEAFKEIVDAVDGVTIDVPNDIYDPFYPTETGGQQLVQFEQGEQEMDGERALQYARSRQTTTDFDRAARQQQIMLAVKDKVSRQDFILDASKITAFQKALDDNITTDLTNPELIRLADIGRQIKNRNITRHVLDNDEESLLIESNLAGYTLSPRVGDFSEIQLFIRNIFEQSEDTLPESHLRDD